MAIVHDAATTAVMMATPSDLEEFAIGFSLTEGIVTKIDEIMDLEIVEVADGIEVRMWLTPERSSIHAMRCRNLIGPTGCGLCGVDSLAAAVRALPAAPTGVTISPTDVRAAVAQLTGLQHLGAATRAVHAAALWSRQPDLCLVREDVGRHNALDKLAGAAALSGIDASDRAVVLTSRVSIEMVQKTAMLGSPVIIAVSAPTAMAIDTADACGITLIGIARDDGFEVFTHPHRLAL